MRINSTIKQNKITILVLQETHLNEESVIAIERCFRKSFNLLQHQENPNLLKSALVHLGILNLQ
jgi:hypothetical protein